MAWKGAVEPAELADGRAAAAVLGLEPAEPLRVVPYAGARDHTLHVFRKIAPTPERFPRRPGIATKRPLSAKTPGHQELQHFPLRAAVRARIRRARR